ncbi:glycosyltransferase family A protein [Arcobacter sp. CECT 8985]|uniref:glycosyltransferase family A protein n=1 Tax=Arcobacter sp. CECT 8985 TaxID=1935424 RepID=UPI002159D0CB|nr:glycosyltransferase family 2 protein [Arcobacter sp. CECT 8985]
MGKNSTKTLEECINHLKNAIKKVVYIEKYEIIYVDSNSSDGSAELAKENGVEVIEIVEGYTTASLGRYLGKKYAKYDNLLFCDSDMYLDIEWFNASKEYYEKYGAIIGERHEKLYRNDIVIKEIHNFYNIEKVEVVNNVGGCLMINVKEVQEINFSPILKEEEERDFFSKFLDKRLIYKIPVKMFIHNNYNLATSRLKSYVYPYNKIGYILSFFSSLKHGYLKNYIKLQRSYLVSVLASLLFYYFLFSSLFLCSLIPIMIIYIENRKYYKGSIITMLFFPYKLLASFLFLTKKLKYTYKYKNKICTESVEL